MGKQGNNVSIKNRDLWVDCVKLFACILVVLGHFFQSMVKADIISDSALYQWFDRTIYYFHVPLFFLCSGFLYQKYSRVTDTRQWLRNLKKKALGLGVPYLFFSVITWLLKNVFTSSVNDQTEGLLYCLVVEPLSPYWYLYVLFLAFAVTPTFQDKSKAAWWLGAAVVMKIASILGCSSFYGLDKLLEYEIWFVLGMCVSIMDMDFLNHAKGFWVGCIAAAAFLAGSIIVEMLGYSSMAIGTCLGALACFAVVSVAHRFANSIKSSGILLWLANYTLPIYLMHTIFAAGFRTVLLKLGITSSLPHMVLGLTVSFGGPVMAAWIMKKIRYADFVLSPGKYIKI